MLTMLTLLQDHNFAENCKKHEKTLVQMGGKDETQLIEALMRVDPLRRNYYRVKLK
jgi:hypothetical protein